MSAIVVSLQHCLDRLKRGDAEARDELIAKVSGRLTMLTARMLREYPGVARWEQADDVFQQAIIRLYRSLADFVPSTAEDFLRLASLQLRRELIDLARHYFGPEGLGANHASSAAGSVDSNGGAPGRDPGGSSSNPEKLAVWTEFHAAIERLPEMEQKVFDLLWYHELDQAAAAELLHVSERQVRRYWQSARLKLQHHLTNCGQSW